MNYSPAAIDPAIRGLSNRIRETWQGRFKCTVLFLVLFSVLCCVARLDAADATVIIPGGNGTFTTNIVFNTTELGAHKTLWVAPVGGYHFKAEPTINCNSSVIMVQQTSYTECGAMYEMWLVGNHQEGTAQISGTITPGSCNSGGGNGGHGGGGGGTSTPPPDRDFSIGLYLGPFIYFTVPTNGTNLTTSVGSTNNLAVRVVLGDATVPASGTVTFSGSPANLGTFNPSSVALTGGVASTTFIASTNGGSGTITATGSNLRHSSGTVAPNVSTNLTVNVLKVVSTTQKRAADGTTPDTRTTVGVCEKVAFVVVPTMSVAWSADDGTPRTGSGTTFSWEAPDKENAKVTISATIGTVVQKIEMKVIKPDSAAWKNLDSTVTNGYSAGFAGCKMKLSKLTITPATVNFERIVIQEVSGPASGIGGYFANNPPWTTNAPSAGPPPVLSGMLWHDADGTNGLGNGPWLSINASNIAGATDTAGWPAPGISPTFVPGGFTDGTFTWAIPMAYRGVASIGAGINFATVNQVYTIKADGTLTVTKDDASICKVSRTP